MGNEQLLLKTVARAFYGNFKSLRPIQESAIPPLLEGKNLILSAGTGIGKTEAVLAPLTSRYYKTAIENDSVTILHIAPTKALVNDLEKRLHLPTAQLNLRLGIRHGDRDDIRCGKLPHVLITTPESLDVILFRDPSPLKYVCAIIIDEVHLLYNTQRGLHLSILLHRLRHYLDHVLQWVALSATMGNLEHVLRFLFGPNEEAIFIHDSTKRPIDAQVRFLQSLDQLRELLARLLKSENHKFLIFANSRRECEEIAESINCDTHLKHIVFTHYSSLSVEMREDVEKAFNRSPSAICIATSTLELGIDIGDINAVFLYGTPSGVDSFLQRIGRGNRRSYKANVICLVRPNSEQPYLEGLIFHSLISLARDGCFPDHQPYEFFGAAAQQALSCIGSAEGKFTRVADLAENCNHLTHLQRSTLEQILANLTHNDYLRAHGFKNRYGAGQKLYELIDFKMIYGNFPLSTQELKIDYGKKTLGYIPRMNLLSLHSGDIMLFAGKRWQIKRISSDGIEVDIPRTNKEAQKIVYLSGGPSIDRFILGAVWELIHDTNFDASLYLSGDRERIQTVIQSITALISKNNLPFCKTPAGYKYYTFAGKLVNRAIALITNQIDFKDEEIFLITIKKIDWSSIPTDPIAYEEIFSNLFEGGKEQTFYQTLLPESLQRQECIQMWLKDSTIGHHLRRLSTSIPHELLPEQIIQWAL